VVSDGVRTEGLLRPESTESRPPDHRLGPALIALGAGIGSIGPLGFTFGRGPVVLASEHRVLALVAIAAIAAITATVAGRARWRALIPSLPLLLLGGAIATWSTAGRITGAWCVLATTATTAILRVGRNNSPSPTCRAIAASGVVGTATAGLLWALEGPGLTPVAIVVLTIGLATILTNDARVVAAGDRIVDEATRATSTSVSRAALAVRSTPHRVRERAAHPGIRSVMAACGLFAAALTAPIFHRLATSEFNLVTGFNDVRSHLEFARAIEWSPPRITVPHPVFHLLVRALGEVVGEPAAVTLVLSAAVGLAVASLTWIGTLPFAGQPGLATRVAPLFSLGWLVAESPTAVLQSAGLLLPDDRYAPLHIWANPTEVIVLPFVFLLVVKVAEVLESSRPDRRLVVVTTLLSTGAALAKPALTVALIPATILIVGFATFRRSISGAAARALLLAVVAPSAAILVWQTWFLENGGVPQGASEFELLPLQTLRSLRLDDERLWFWSLLVLVVVAVWIGGRRFIGDPVMRVTLTSLAMALAIMAIVHEGGVRASDGNLAKPAMFAWMLLATWSLRVVVGGAVGQQAGDCSERQRSLGSVASGATLLVLALGGFAAWLDAVGVLSTPGWGVST
jgi:hypothetical protein